MNSDSSVSNGTAPFVTVIMPVRNEAAYISRSLGAVLQQTYPHERMEVLIADGMSTDGTREQIHAVIADAPDIPVRIIDNPKQIVPTGMNLALQAARGDVIIRVDGHCVIAPDYVSRCVEHLTSDSIDGVGGPINTIGSDTLSQAIALAMSTGFGVGGSAFRTSKQEQALVDTIPFPAYTRRAVETAGPYDETLVRNQDDEYNYRLRHLGFRLLLSPNVRSSYYSRSTLGALWRQYFQYGFYKVRVLQKHPRQMRPRQFVPVLFVAGTLSTGLLGLFLKPFRWLCLSVLALYTVVTMFVSWSIAARKGLRLLLILPAVFATLHVSYGAGFLLGLVRFARQGRDRGYVG